ncbi:MAG: 6-phosphogluconolactonase [Blastocatellia bacterium]|nr:6-phosphogluconolactonase [Blastocatellia bacterium]
MRTLPLTNGRVEVYADAAELAREAARRFAALAGTFIANRGRFTVALSGGSTPRAMFTLLAAPPFSDALAWRAIHLFWGDERCVPPDHPDSNYRMTRETLLDRVPLPPENVHRIPAEDPDPARAAERYAETLRHAFGEDAPRFDLLFLGMGADAHTASLFPGTAALHNNDRIVVAQYVEKLQAHRLTLTARTINHANNILFLVAGADKAPALQAVLEGPRDIDTFPSQLIAPDAGTLTWMVDEAAAGQLSVGGSP